MDSKIQLLYLIRILVLILIGQKIGAQLVEEAKIYRNYFVIIGFLESLIIMVLMFLLRTKIANFYTDIPSLAHSVASVLVLISVF